MALFISNNAGATPTFMHTAAQQGVAAYTASNMCMADMQPSHMWVMGGE